MRFALAALLLHLVATFGCTPPRGTVAPRAPRAEVADVTRAKPGGAPLDVETKPSTIVELVRAARPSARRVAVLTEDGKATPAAHQLEDAGLGVTVFSRTVPFAERRFDAVVVDGAPPVEDSESLAAARSARSSDTVAVVSWPSTSFDVSTRQWHRDAIELADGREHFAVFMPGSEAFTPPDGVRTPNLFALTWESETEATAVGCLVRLPNGELALALPEDPGHTSSRVLLRGRVPAPPSSQGGASSVQDVLGRTEPSSSTVVAVRGRTRLVRGSASGTTFAMDVIAVHVRLEASAYEATERAHKLHVERALRALRKNDLEAAATSLEAAAQLVDDALSGLGTASRRVRFEREIARRLRRVHEHHDDPLALVDRIARHEPDRGSDWVETAIVRAAIDLARPQLEARLRAQIADGDDLRETGARYRYAIERLPPRALPELYFRAIRGSSSKDVPPFFGPGEPRLF